MKTIIRKITGDPAGDREAVLLAGEILKKGGLVAFPTETVYGLGANGLDEEAAAKTYAAKGRPSDNPLIVHIAGMETLDKIVTEIPEAARKAAEAFWPGPMTMIFHKADIVPYGTTGGLDTVAVRMPSHPTAAALIRAGGGYISAPSANTSGRPSPTTAEHVIQDLDGKIDMILDGGPVDIGLESSILDVTVDPPMILRPGAITKEMFEEVLGEVRIDRALISDDSKIKPKAPGMKYRHYAPKAKLVVVEGAREAVCAYICERILQADEEGRRIGIIATEETKDAYTGGIVKCIGTRQDETTIARGLFGALREFDAEAVDVIYSEAFPEEGLGRAIMNRLLKAAGQTRIQV